MHTATLLPDGTVLIAGGFYIDSLSNFHSLSTAELYDPVAGTFSYANGTMNEGRFGSTATLLNNGQVLIAGGNYYPPSGGVGPSDSELYDPSTQTFAVTAGAMITPRQHHTATLLNDGTVLITGGDSQNNTVLVAGAEIYDPVANTFSATGSLNTASESHVAALLGSGKVLIAGGNCGGNCTPSVLARTEIYDPSTKLFTYGPNLALPRGAATGTVLNNGTVLIAGGQTNSAITGTAEIVDPVAQNIIGAGSMLTARDSQTATLLSDGTVLLASGSGYGGLLLSAELYAPTPPPPFSLQVTPSAANMLIGSAQQFTAVNSIGYPRADATWTVSDQSLASIAEWVLSHPYGTRCGPSYCYSYCGRRLRSSTGHNIASWHESVSRLRDLDCPAGAWIRSRSTCAGSAIRHGPGYVLGSIQQRRYTIGCSGFHFCRPTTVAKPVSSAKQQLCSGHIRRNACGGTPNLQTGTNRSHGDRRCEPRNGGTDLADHGARPSRRRSWRTDALLLPEPTANGNSRRRLNRHIDVRKHFRTVRAHGRKRPNRSAKRQHLDKHPHVKI